VAGNNTKKGNVENRHLKPLKKSSYIYGVGWRRALHAIKNLGDWKGSSNNNTIESTLGRVGGEGLSYSFHKVAKGGGACLGRPNGVGEGGKAFQKGDSGSVAGVGKLNILEWEETPYQGPFGSVRRALKTQEEKKNSESSLPRAVSKDCPR